MKLIVFLLKMSWRMALLAALVGAVSGAASAGLVALISHALETRKPLFDDPHRPFRGPLRGDLADATRVTDAPLRADRQFHLPVAARPVPAHPGVAA